MKKIVFALAFPIALLVPSLAWADAFTYHDYDGMVADLNAMASSYPELTELFTAQDRYGLPVIPDGDIDLETYILRITNEALGLDKPEVLLVGVQHGDEIVGLEVLLATAELLLSSYGNDPWLTELVDRREIYFVPLANPFGFRHGTRSSPGTEGSEDMNRDHIYDRSGCNPFCSDEDSLSTVGARAIHELARRHLFRVMLDYHGGVELILHPWGSPLHTGNTESPDDEAHDLLGQCMRVFGGSYNGFYPVGTANDLLGPANGPLDDTAYAGSWDAGNADPLWPTVGWQALAYTVEISNAKSPPESTLGGDAELLVPGGSEDGYVPKNVRIALATIDAVEPYVLWTNRASTPTQVEVGEMVNVEWQVRGCFEVDETRVRYGTDADPVNTFDDQTAAQSDNTDPCFTPTTSAARTFNATVSFDAPGIYYLAPVGRVDSVLLDQNNPVPSQTPRSWWVRSRTENDYFFSNTVEPSEINTVSGSLYWGAEALMITVGSGEIFADGFESGSISGWSSSVP